MVVCKSRCARRIYSYSTFFLIYITDLLENIESTIKLFADNIFLVLVVHYSNTSTEELSKDLQI